MDKYTVLIVDDNMQNLRVVASILGETDCEIGFAQNGAQALEFITEIKPDVILLDVMMPEMDGYEVCQRIKMTPGYEDVPIIFLTAKDERDDIVKGFEMGAIDYITKPFNSAELKMRINGQMKIKQHLDALKIANKKLEELSEKLLITNTDLEKMASTDQLTGIWNRRFFSSKISEFLEKPELDHKQSTLMLIDLDNFKEINDKYGHQVGDQVLVECVKVLSECLTEGEILARWGGEEFILLVKDRGEDDTYRLAENLRKVVELSRFSINLKLTVSIGSAGYCENDTLDTWMKRADDALYEAKNSGRNRLVYYR